MNSIVRNYIPYIAVMIGLPAALLAISMFSGEPYSSTAIFNTMLIAGLSMLANDGLASYFPREILAKRSLASLIEQHVLMGLVFAGTMTLFFAVTQTGLSRDFGKVLLSFVSMAVFFGGAMLVSAIFARRKLLKEL